MKYKLQLLAFFILACTAASPWSPAYEPSRQLPAPVLVAPADEARMHGYPRTVVFQWNKVPDAIGYGIEIDYYARQRWTMQTGKPTLIQFVKEPTFTFNFYGNQPGSWRVWALDKKWHPGKVSAWSVFSFGPESEAMPPPPPDTPPDLSRFTTAIAVSQQNSQQKKMLDFPRVDPKTGEPCDEARAPGQAEGITMPKPVFHPEPEYTEAARSAKENGLAVLAVDIGEDGLVKRVCLLKATRDDLGMEAVKTVRTWRFQPAKKDDAPIPYSMNVEVSFNIFQGH